MKGKPAVILLPLLLTLTFLPVCVSGGGYMQRD